MESLRELYRIGGGPSSSHALGPQAGALIFRAQHRISFDEVVEALVQTGRDLTAPYRDTAQGGLARVHRVADPGPGDWRRGS